MTIKTLTAKFIGINPLLQNNPQTVDRFNPYTRAMKAINDKKTRRTDDDYMELKRIEVRSKIFWDDAVGVYVPSTWVLAALAANAFKTVKISKDSVRAGVFTTTGKLALKYRGMEKVKAPEDIVQNGEFRIDMTLPQGQVRVVKAVPIFHDWSFECPLEFDDEVIDLDSMQRVIHRMARYGGFGDFRPTFGRAEAEVSSV